MLGRKGYRPEEIAHARGALDARLEARLGTAFLAAIEARSAP